MGRNKLHRLICKMCNSEFENKNRTKKFCSDGCLRKGTSEFQKKYKNSEIGRIKNSEAQKIAQNRPEVKSKKSRTSREVSNRPEVKKKFSQWSKEYQNREDVKKAKSEWTKKYFKENPHARFDLAKSVSDYFKNVYPNDNEAKIKRSNSAKKVSSQPDIRKKRSMSMGKYWGDPENRIRQGIKQKEIQGEPEMIEKHRKNTQKLWEDPEYVNKVFLSRYRKFTFPSGRVVNTQGYENMVLDDLLKIYDESDIFVGASEIRNQIGRIKYTFDGKIRSYYPDIYIKSINLIIEVKSEYTFNQHREINLAKEKACLEAGINFKFEIR